MNRLTDNDRNWGPFTLARWKHRISAHFCTGDDEDPENHLLFVAFGWALRVKLWTKLKPGGKYGEHERTWGFAITGQGDTIGSDYSYDAIHVKFGIQTYDSSTEKDWFKTFPWKDWEMIRHSVHAPDGHLYATWDQDKPRWPDFCEKCEECPKVHFKFRDYDGKEIVATCYIEEREWRRGREPFEWLRFFYPPIIRRSLDLRFDAEVGPEKGSWKGGTLGTSCEMLEGDTPETAFKRWCDKEQRSKYRPYRVTYIGPCEPSTPILSL